MKTLKTRVIAMVVEPENSSDIYDEMSTIVKIESEGAGEYIEISQLGGSVKFNPEEWPYIKEVVEQLLENCKS